MNKHLHRIIFNPARGLRMVVQETATSAGKANGATRGSRPTVGFAPAGVGYGRLAHLAFAVLCLLGVPLQLTSMAHAQIVADPNAPRNQQPTVLNTANGLPLVNIQTPSAAGVSRNTYGQFDVNATGAVLNNSRTNTQTQLGGWVQGNPWLATGSARVILNEVNSSNPSQLRGFVEVAGSRAEVIIANPAGVNIDGAGFINASRATITTGTASVSGGNLDGYVVQRGLVTINGAGLDARQTDYTSILARAVEVNGQILANELKVITGANQIDAAQTSATPVAGTGAAPAFALDASALGGMYAGKITLIGTEAGVGMRIGGVIGATAGDVVLQANGWLTNIGSIQATGNAQINTGGSVTNRGTVYANGNTGLAAVDGITNTGLVAAQGNTSVQATGAGAQISASKGSVIAAGLNPDGTLRTSGDLIVSGTAAVALIGQTIAGGNAEVSGARLDLSGGKLAAQNFTLSAAAGDMDASQAGISTQGVLAISAAQTVRTDGATVAAQQLSLKARDLSNMAGEIVQTGNTDLAILLSSPTGTLDNTRGRIAVNSQNLTLSANTLTNTDGKIEHAGSGTLAIDATVLNDQRGQITGNGALSITADSINHQNAHSLAQQVTVAAGNLNNHQGEITQVGSGQATLSVRGTLDNSAGTIASNGSASISAQTLDNSQGRITSAQSADFTVAASLNNTDGSIAAGQNLSLASGSIDNTRGTLQSTQGDTTLNVGNLNNHAGSVYAGGSLSTTAVNVTSTGSLYAAGSQILTVSGAVSNTGVIAARGNTTITADNLNSAATSLLGAGIASDGSLGNAGNLSVSTTGALTARGQNLAAGDATMSGALVDLSSSQTSASAITLTATASNVNTSAATLTTPGTLHITAKTQNAQTLNNRGGTLSAGQLNLDSANLNNAQGQIIQTGASNTTIALSSPTGTLDNTQGRIAGNSQNLTLSANTLTNTDGKIEHAGSGTLAIDATVLNDQRGQITGNGVLSITAGSVDHRNASTIARQVTIAASSLNNQQGEIIQTGSGQTRITATDFINNTAGRIETNDAAFISTGTLDNTQGRITSGQSVLITTSGSMNNTDGTLAASRNLGLVGGNVDNTRGTLQAVTGNVTLQVGDLSNNAGAVYAGANLTTSASNVINTGSLYAGGNQVLAVSGNASNVGVIAAQGDVSITADSMNSSATGLLGAGIRADGSLSTAGQLRAATANGLVAKGQNLAAGSATLTGASVDLTGSQTSAASIAITATAGNVTTSAATVTTPGTLDVSAKAQGTQSLVNSQGTISAGQLNLDVANLNNAQGQIIQTGLGNTTIALSSPLGTLNNSAGRIAVNSQNLSLSAASFLNTDGRIEHAGTGTLAIDSNSLNDQRGQITGNGALIVNTGVFNHDNASTVAKQISLSATSLSNRSGEIIQTGSGVTTFTALGAIDNTAGVIASNGTTSVSGQTLSNQGGTIQATGASGLSLSVNAGLDNSGAGKLAAGGDFNLVAGALNNSQGSITAGGGLDAALAQGLSNSQGLIAANGDVSLAAASLDNSRGTIASVQGSATINSIGATQNDSGKIQSALDVTLVNTGLSNAMATGAAQAGSITAGRNASIQTNGQALHNAQGTIAASQLAGLQTGALNNDGGLIQAGTALSVNTSGQTLSNANASQHVTGAGGITSQGTMALATGDINNARGFVGAKGALTATAANIGNTAGGQIVGQSGVSISSSGFDNWGGQVQALGSLGIDAGAGSINNSDSLMRSAENLSLSAATVLNSNTLGGNQGMEAKNVAITASAIANNQGAIRADNNAILTSSGSIDNSGGLISAGNTASLQDLAAAKTLAISNTAGTLIAGQNTVINASSLSGDGKVLSRGDLSIALVSDFNNSGEVTANRNASITTGANLSNSGKLQAGNILTVNAQSIDNAGTGEITGAVTQVNAANALTNRGLIDGQDTRINAATLNNLGTGRIYGDRLSIAAVTVNNDFENGRAGTIAARERLDIGAQTINNREHALIFSAGNMGIGATLDANRQASGQASALNNNSATIEALGDLNLSAVQLNNTNEHFAYELRVTSVEVNVREDISPTLYRVFTRTTQTPVATYSDPANLLAGGNLTLNSQNPVNANSHIVAGGLLKIVAAPLVNADVMADKLVTDSGTTYTLVHYPTTGHCGFIKINCVRAHDDWVPGPYDITTPLSVPVSQITPTQASGETINASVLANVSTGTVAASATMAGFNSAAINPDAGTAGQFNAIAAAGRLANTAYGAGGLTQVAPSLAARVTITPASGSAAQAALGANALTRAQVNPITQVKLASPSGGVQVVRTTTPPTLVPNTSLFRINPAPAANFLVETDPRFANYRQWLGSDYLLSQIKLDPGVTQKRLGDGFYEQKLVREQLMQLTGQRFLADYSSDEAQYRALMDSGLTFAKTHNLRPGIALSAAQMAQLTADIVWLVEQEVTLADGSRQKALVPQVYVRVREGDLNGSGALLAGKEININLTGNLTNSGTIAGRSIVALSADNLNNLAGRLNGDAVSVTARTDLNNIGGTISANNRLEVAAGRDINLETTTRSASNAVGANTFSRTGIDRVAGLYVSNPGGVLVASAGRDTNILGGVISNAGEGGATVLAAGRNLNLATVTTQEANMLVWDAQNRLSYSHSNEVGSQVNAQGSVLLQAGADINARAANVQAGNALTAVAGNNINITAGRNTSTLDEAHQFKSRGFLSSTTTTTLNQFNRVESAGSSFGASTVMMSAGNNLLVNGSSITSDKATALVAGNNLIIESAQNTTSESHFLQEKKSGIMLNGSLSNPNSLSLDFKRGASSNATSASTTEAGSTVTSANGATTLIAQNGILAVIASNVSAGSDKQLKLQGAQVYLSGGLNSEETTLESKQNATNIHAGIVKPSEGLFSRGGVKGTSGQTTLAATTLAGGNISIQATGKPGQTADGQDLPSGISLAGVKLTTPGELKLDAGDGKLAFNIIQTTTSTSRESTQRDLVYQKAKGQGTTSTDAEYNDLTYGKLTIKTPNVVIQQARSAGAAGALTPASLSELGSKPGMGWIADVQRQQAELARTNPAAALHIQNVKLAHEQWDYKQQGLTPEGAVIVTIVVAYFTAGAGTSLVGAATTTAGVTTTTVAGAALATTTAVGVTTYTAVGAAINAGFSSLVTQASIAFVNNNGDIGATLKQLGSSDSIKQTVAAMLTAGVGTELPSTGISSVAAQTATGCVTGSITGIGCSRGATNAAFTSGAAFTYNGAVGYAASAGPGFNPENPIYEVNTTPGSPVYGQQPIVSQGANVIGFNGPNSAFSQGGQISQTLNRVPFINATAGFHDWLFNANPKFNDWFSVLNVPTMIPAALLSIPAALNNPNLSWVLVNGAPYNLNYPNRPPTTPSAFRISETGPRQPGFGASTLRIIP
ncbi:filamentous hemagglutinin N-terminal domain-containing protein [Polaromonas sp.]|uniref:two-partner secretion domain-containing protein n=1 Tax=Polaromonas sp. TaxID=1869339 RepID=UPI00180D5788|nr:filamentous hemagglutinin N-terminal domain-containing protein [Polaromonas sp.]NMM07118.1 filamentous hemagglutinin N-terminal domain-containing protein [Polaromonas sp.]